MASVKETVAAITSRKARARSISQDEAMAEVLDLYAAIATDIVRCVVAIGDHRSAFIAPNPTKMAALASVFRNAATDIAAIDSLPLGGNDVLAPMKVLARSVVKGLSTMTVAASDKDVLVAFDGMRNFLSYFNKQVIQPLRQDAADHERYLAARGVSETARTRILKVIPKG